MTIGLWVIAGLVWCFCYAKSVDAVMSMYTIDINKELALKGLPPLKGRYHLKGLHPLQLQDGNYEVPKELVEAWKEVQQELSIPGQGIEHEIIDH